MTRGSRIGAPAFTLVEMAVSLAIASVLLLAMGSVMALAARAVPEPDNRGARALEAARALDMIADDLAYATAIERGAGVRARLADRDGDGSDEEVEYALASGQRLVAVWRGAVDREVPLLDGVASAEFKVDTRDGLATAATVTVVLADMPAEPFVRRVALVNRPAS